MRDYGKKIMIYEIFSVFWTEAAMYKVSILSKVDIDTNISSFESINFK